MGRGLAVAMSELGARVFAQQSKGQSMNPDSRVFFNRALTLSRVFFTVQTSYITIECVGGDDRKSMIVDKVVKATEAIIS